MRIGDRQSGLDDPAQREQHALLVVAGDLRCARGQDQLAAVGVDIGGEEGDVLLLGRRLDDIQQPMQRVTGRGSSLPLDQRIDPVETEERNR